jgi:hypothetical protein
MTSKMNHFLTSSSSSSGFDIGERLYSSQLDQIEELIVDVFNRYASRHRNSELLAHDRFAWSYTLRCQYLVTEGLVVSEIFSWAP